MGHAFVVFNPVAGRSSDGLRQKIADHLEEAGWSFEIYETTGREQVARVVETALERAGRDLVVAAGGDGTVAGVAGGLIRTGVPMGVLPLGTGNVFSRELGIPERIREALSLLTGDHGTMRVDAMEVEGQFFLLNVSAGLSSMMMRGTATKDKRRLGRLAYVWTGLQKIAGHQPHRFSLTIDGQHHVQRAAEVIVANSGALGDPSFRWSPEVELNDGRVDVGVVRARSAWDYLQVAFALVLRGQPDVGTIQHLIAERNVIVDATPRLPMQGDGQFIGYPPVEVKVVPNALYVVVPGETAEGLVLAKGLNPSHRG